MYLLCGSAEVNSRASAQGEFKYNKNEEKSVEAKTLGIGHGSREVGRKTCTRRATIKCVLTEIWAVITVEDSL
jgi:hypothetical protein